MRAGQCRAPLKRWMQCDRAAAEIVGGRSRRLPSRQRVPGGLPQGSPRPARIPHLLESPPGPPHERLGGVSRGLRVFREGASVAKQFFRGKVPRCTPYRECAGEGRAGITQRESAARLNDARRKRQATGQKLNDRLSGRHRSWSCLATVHRRGHPLPRPYRGSCRGCLDLRHCPNHCCL